MPYLLAANVFIQAKNLHYGFNFCPVPSSAAQIPRVTK